MEPIESRAGPYEESGELSLECVVMGGKHQKNINDNFTFAFCDYISTSLKSENIDKALNQYTIIIFNEWSCR